MSDLESRTGASVPMTRREALKAATALMGALAVPGLLAGCAPDGRDTASASRASAQDDQALLEDIADTLHWLATLPPHLNINTIEMMPVTQSFAGFTVAREEATA